MRIALYIYLGIVLFNCLVVFCLYFLDMGFYKKYQDQLNYLKALKLAKHAKTA